MIGGDNLGNEYFDLKYKEKKMHFLNMSQNSPFFFIIMYT